MDDLVTITFVNRDGFTDDGKPEIDEMRVSRASAHRVIQWYGGYCAGDDYDVLIDGDIVETDLNGQISPLGRSDSAGSGDIAVTIDSGGIAEATIEGTWQTLRLRASVEEEPDDSWLTILGDKGQTVTIACDVMEKALPLLSRFGRTGMLHVADAPPQDPSVAEAFMELVEKDGTMTVVSDVDGHKGVYAMNGDKVVRLYGDTEMPFDGSAKDFEAIAADGTYYINPR